MKRDADTARGPGQGKGIGSRPQGERLSFQDLLEELGESPLPPPDDGLHPMHTERLSDGPDSDKVLSDSPADGEWFGTISGDMPVPSPRRKREDNPLNTRLLSESGAKKTPLWVQTLYMALAAWLLLLPVLTGMLASVLQPWYSYSTAVLGGGAAFWAAYGMYHEDGVSLRTRCLGGFLLGLGAAVLAVLTRTRGIIL